ncbi:hypothetical protein [Rhodococcus wratislaviensis]|uniref:hypothetical protein n=1 Tax=Rhodococcus wratislaviensis TaxID=44752 RepID=UPI0036659152
MSHGSFHTVAATSSRDDVAALNSALATAMRTLQDQIREAEVHLPHLQMRGIHHTHTLVNVDGVPRAVVSAVVLYEY